MIKKVRIGLMILLALGIMVSILTPVYANGPMPPSTFYVKVFEAPPEAFAVDFLVQKDILVDQELWVECDSDFLHNRHIEDDCELALYNDDGYVSVQVHCKSANTAGHILEKTIDGETFLQAKYEVGMGAYSFLADQTDLKLAVYDKTGKILCVSQSFAIHKETVKSFKGNISLYCDSGIVEVERIKEEFLYYFLAFLLIFLCAVVTAGVELLVALCFRIKPVWRVPVVTAVTNLIMNICIYNFQMKANYLLLVALGEVAAILVEMAVYFVIYKNISKARLAVFTVVANLVSLIVSVYSVALYI